MYIQKNLPSHLLYVVHMMSMWTSVCLHWGGTYMYMYTGRNDPPLRVGLLYDAMWYYHMSDHYYIT